MSAISRPAPVVLDAGAILLEIATRITYRLGWQRWAFNRINLMQSPFPVELTQFTGALFLLAVFAILVFRFTRTRSAEERFAGELEAARVVQQVLVPDNIPAIPGFQIQSVYKPAGQAGGDFSQVLPLADGGLLAVIGDVSGKGMPAAMNRRMLARSHGGFTTYLVLRCDADGKLTIANAGHIAPYIAGKELPLENGLPLGLSADTTYAESCFQLAPGLQLTLLTDGVVEARDKAGAVLGFERSAALSGESADQIAKTGELFGQDDDITVLTLSYGDVPASA